MKEDILSRDTFRSRTDYPHWASISTRWHDNDVFGHVNNVVYYSWFDTVVCGWLIEQGLLDFSGGHHIGLVVETGCTYRRSLAFPEPVEVGLRVARIGSSSVTYHLGVFTRGSDEPSAEGHFTHVYVDATSRRPKPLSDAWRTVLQTIS